MSARTEISWTDATWNPVRGCSLVSAGCANCYAMKFAHRFSGKGKPYEGLTEPGPQGPRWTGKITLVPAALEEPLRWKQPRRIFVNSMSDLFHEDVPDQFIYKAFITMAQCQRHTFQILTKRPERMRRFTRRIRYIDPGFNGHALGNCSYWPNDPDKHPIETRPLPNVWLGVSCEDQATADERILILLNTPAAVRFISAEPLLGPVSFRWAKWDDWKDVNGGRRQSVNQHDGLRMLDWAIIGGESGPGARPCDLAWIRSIKAQCQAANVPVFVKQIGSSPLNLQQDGITRLAGKHGLRTFDKKGEDMAEWPEDLRVREFPNQRQ